MRKRSKSEMPAGRERWSATTAARAVSLLLATLTTDLVAGLFYAYSVSVNLGLAAQPDASYVSTMNAINERIQNPLFFASFFGAILRGAMELLDTTRGVLVSDARRPGWSLPVA